MDLPPAPSIGQIERTSQLIRTHALVVPVLHREALVITSELTSAAGGARGSVYGSDPTGQAVLGQLTNAEATGPDRWAPEHTTLREAAQCVGVALEQLGQAVARYRAIGRMHSQRGMLGRSRWTPQDYDAAVAEFERRRRRG